MRIDDAIVFAGKAHEGAKRKGLNQPYIFHPLEVLNLVSMMTDDDDILCAAVLHDTVEDTPATVEEIKEQFGERVAKLVAYESEDKKGQVNKAGTWLERKQEAINTLNRVEDIGAKMVALGDKVSNLRSFHLLQMQQGEDCWNNFNMKDPLKHYWYYQEVAKALSDLKDNVVYKEYLFLIDAVFSKYTKE